MDMPVMTNADNANTINGTDTVLRMAFSFAYLSGVLECSVILDVNFIVWISLFEFFPFPCAHDRRVPRRDRKRPSRLNVPESEIKGCEAII
jgi:hypothetical protein